MSAFSGTVKLTRSCAIESYSLHISGIVYPLRLGEEQFAFFVKKRYAPRLAVNLYRCGDAGESIVLLVGRCLYLGV